MQYVVLFCAYVKFWLCSVYEIVYNFQLKIDEWLYQKVKSSKSNSFTNGSEGDQIYKHALTQVRQNEKNVSFISSPISMKIKLASL